MFIVDYINKLTGFQYVTRAFRVCSHTAIRKKFPGPLYTIPGNGFFLAAFYYYLGILLTHGHYHSRNQFAYGWNFFQVFCNLFHTPGGIIRTIPKYFHRTSETMAAVVFSKSLIYCLLGKILNTGVHSCIYADPLGSNTFPETFNNSLPGHFAYIVGAEFNFRSMIGGNDFLITGRFIFFSGNVSVLQHFAEHHITTFLSIFRMRNRIISRRSFGKSCKNCHFTYS